MQCMFCYYLVDFQLLTDSLSLKKKKKKKSVKSPSVIDRELSQKVESNNP